MKKGGHNYQLICAVIWLIDDIDNILMIGLQACN